MIMKKILYVILFAIAVLVSGCNHHDKISTDLIQNPNTASGMSDMSKLPVITFNTTTHNFGDLMQGETVSYTFKFKNEGKSDLLISSASSGCKCTNAKYPDKIVKPGAESYIEVTFDPTGVVGFQNKIVKVVTNAQPNVVNLYIIANVKTGIL